MADNEEYEGASVKERLIAACRDNNDVLLKEIISNCKSEDEISNLMNNTTSVLGDHLYHVAASRGNYEIIDILLDQPNFECDPLNRSDGDTPLHTAIKWINKHPEEREFGNGLVEMMLEASPSSTRVRNKARQTPSQVVDKKNTGLRDLIQKYEYIELNRGDFVDNTSGENAGAGAGAAKTTKNSSNNAGAFLDVGAQGQDDDDDDAEFSGSDEEERAEWERRRKAKGL
ncbi:ankyrin repeat protein [Xylariomycetidae sp. FL2044]|nr:ankyrin repeat protein [Xylariomycetidae sp. FL2044]